MEFATVGFLKIFFKPFGKPNSKKNIKVSPLYVGLIIICMTGKITLYVPPGVYHRFKNLTVKGLVMHPEKL